MRSTIIVSMLSTLGMVGCAGVPGSLIKTNEAASIDVIGAPGGYQVRNITVTPPDLSCAGRSYPETQDAFLAGFKQRYVKTWNDTIAARSPVAILAKTPKQKQRLAYFHSKEIRLTNDMREAMQRYEINPSRVLMEKSPRDSNPAEREEYMHASCIRSAFHKGGSKGIDQAQDDVRAVIERAPPDV